MPRRTVHTVSGVYAAIPQHEYAAPSTCEDKVVRVLESSTFQALMGVLIVVNAAMIGLETDMPDAFPWDVFELIFLGVFLVELLVKLLCLGVKGFVDPSGPDFAWNMFDSFIVGAGAIDFGLSTIAGLSAGGVATIFRLVRLLRIMRLFRIVRYLKQLYFIAYGFVVATQAVFWVSIVMGFILFVSSVVIARTLGTSAHAHPESDMHESFGSVSRSMLTLFELMAVPDLRNLNANGLLLSRPYFLAFLVVYIVFGSFGMIALLTGVISESIFEKNALRIEEARVEHEQRNEIILNTCGAIFDQCPCNEDDEITRQDVEDVLPQIAELLDKFDVDYTDHELEHITDLMDKNCNDLIDRSEFTETIMRQVEGVKPMSMQEMQYDVSWCRNKLGKLLPMVEDLLALQVATVASTSVSTIANTIANGSAKGSRSTNGSNESRRTSKDKSNGERVVTINPRKVFRSKSPSNSKNGSDSEGSDSPPLSKIPARVIARRASCAAHIGRRGTLSPCTLSKGWKSEADASKTLLDKIDSSIQDLHASQSGIAAKLSQAEEAKDWQQRAISSLRDDITELRKRVEDVLMSSSAHREVSLGLQQELHNFRLEHLDGFTHIQSLQSRLRRDLAELQTQTVAARTCSNDDMRPAKEANRQPAPEGATIWEAAAKAIPGMPEPARLPMKPLSSQPPSEGTTVCASESCEPTSSMAVDSPGLGFGLLTPDATGHSHKLCEPSICFLEGSHRSQLLVDCLTPQGLGCSSGQRAPAQSWTMSAGSSFDCSPPHSASPGREHNKLGVCSTMSGAASSPEYPLMQSYTLCPELDRGEQ